jgi:predicted membrane channel-forming protein YqfA (hemolysin III family)
MEYFKRQTAEIINHLFQSLLVGYLILLLIEQVWTGSVAFYLNLNYLLILVIISGILDVFSEPKYRKEKDPTKKDYLFIIVLGITGFMIIKLKTVQLGWLSWIISIIAGILIILLSILVLEEKD